MASPKIRTVPSHSRCSKISVERIVYLSIEDFFFFFGEFTGLGKAIGRRPHAEPVLYQLLLTELSHKSTVLASKSFFQANSFHFSLKSTQSLLKRKRLKCYRNTREHPNISARISSED